MRQKCDDPKYRHREATLIQEKHSDPVYRQKEASLKQEKVLVQCIGRKKKH